MSDKAKKLDWVPDWVAELLLDWRNNGSSGSLRLNFNDGGIRNVTTEKTHWQPKKEAGRLPPIYSLDHRDVRVTK